MADTNNPVGNPAGNNTGAPASHGYNEDYLAFKRGLLELNLDVFDYGQNKRTKPNGYQNLHFFVRKLPKNVFLIKQNKFTGKISFIAGDDWFHFVHLHSAIRFLVEKRDIDFRPQKNLTTTEPTRSSITGMKSYTIPMIDCKIGIKLTDPVLFAEQDRLAGGNKEQKVLFKLYDLVNSLFSAFVHNHKWAELLKLFTVNGGYIDVKSFDPVGVLTQFNNDNGVEITEFRVQGFEVPEEAKAMTKAETEAAIDQVKNMQKIKNAQAEAQTRTIIGDASADVDEKRAKALRDGGLDPNGASTVLAVDAMRNLPEGVRPVVTLGNGGSGADTAAQVAQAMAIAQQMSGGNQPGSIQQRPIQQAGPAGPGLTPLSPAFIDQFKAVLNEGLTLYSPGSKEHTDFAHFLSDVEANPQFYLNNPANSMSLFNYFNSLVNVARGKPRTRK